jgi:NAD(P)-dependent dehydrogenase (short-subunit alcohol dehydrogenase family)
MVEVNVLSGVRLCRLYVPAMRRRGWGRVIFIATESGLLIPVEMMHYGASKTMQIAVARGLATELAGTGVTVNSVLPGPTRSAGFSVQFEAEAKRTGRTVQDLEQEVITRGRPTSLIRRIAEPQEVANLVAYVAGEGSGATTGASLRVDGGIVPGL